MSELTDRVLKFIVAIMLFVSAYNKENSKEVNTMYTMTGIILLWIPTEKKDK